jgi:exosortase/archaeosortase family protein
VLRKLLTVPTVTILTAVLKHFFNVSVSGNYIYVNGVVAEVAQSCLAIIPFFLLFVLLFSTADIKPAKRIFAMTISFAVLFVLNIARMSFLVFIIHKPYFDTAHLVLQHFFLMIAVAAIWIGITFIIKIKTIPVYSDMKYLYSLTRKHH